MLETVLHARGAAMSRIDARLRVAGAVIFACAAAPVENPWAAGFALGVSLALLALAWLPPRLWLRRLIPLNLMLLTLFILLPLGGGTATLALLIALKANAIMLTLTALLSTLEAVELGHALQQLHCPAKLVHLLLFTVRYLDVLHREYERLRNAMRARAFQPRLDRHTLRTYGYLVGMLLVRAFERAERIEQAMRCRGFRGRYPAVATRRLNLADGLYSAAFAAVAAGIVLGGWPWV